MLRVCHVSPTYFAAESLVGGGERFAEELARALAKLADVRFVSFGPRALRERAGERYERVILKSWTSRPLTPFSPRLFSELRGADIIHCHQYFVLPTFLAAAFGRARGSRVFVTDLGGGGWTPGYQIDQSRWISGHLPISEYAARALPGRPRPHRVIHGGVDPARFAMRSELSHDDSVLFLGRVLPHKGVHFLIEALPADRTLHVVGPTPNAAYLRRLQALAAGRDVRFHAGLPDRDVISYLQRAMVLVHPTPVDDNGSAGASELFGLALVEAMACGCPVIASRAASLPEIVVDGETGLLVPPNSVAALASAISGIAADAARWRRLARSARQRVEARFTWDHVAAACMSAYQELA
jgi:glycosyltransferase involved in cell wall biosynthesis